MHACACTRVCACMRECGWYAWGGMCSYMCLWRELRLWTPRHSGLVISVFQCKSPVDDKNILNPFNLSHMHLQTGFAQSLRAGLVQIQALRWVCDTGGKEHSSFYKIRNMFGRACDGLVPGLWGTANPENPTLPTLWHSGCQSRGHPVLVSDHLEIFCSPCVTLFN